MFSDILRSLRKDHGNISQAALAEELQVSQQAVGRWEKDLNMPDYDILKRLAIFFHVSTDYLLEMPGIKGVKETLSADEQELLDGYRTLDIWGKNSLLSLMHNELARVEATTAQKPKKKGSAM